MMRLRSFYHILLFSATLVSLASCGAGQKGRSPAQVFSSSLELEAVRDLTPEERVIATRICYAYESKNTNFRTPAYLGKSFNFNLSSTSCSFEKKNSDVSATLVEELGTLLYRTSSNEIFNNKVQTNRLGYLSQLCTKIQQNLSISNTVAIGNSKIQIFFNKNFLDSYTLQIFVPDNSGKMVVQSSETYNVRTQFNLSAGEILGMDESYSKFQVCPNDPANYSELFQSFTGLN